MAPEAVELAILVDDNDIDLFVQKRFVEINRFAKRVITYNSPVIAVSALMDADNTSIPELIFLDLNMPEMDGFDFLESFKRFPQAVKDKTKVVVVTSSSSQADKERALSFDAVIHFMSKPLSDKDLEKIREKILMLSKI
jgi:two-component system, NarL family, nitrate/nitrite response regulator NarL